MRRIGILTSGGDAPGMNAAIRAAIRTALKNDLEIYGIEDGYLGLVQGKIFPLRYKDASEILTKGGTFLGSSRYPEFKEDAIQEKAVEQLRKRGIEGLVVIGGDGSYRGAQALMKKGVLCVGIPATIDNDVKGTDKTIGFSTALNTICESVNKLRDTSSSHHRCFIVEVMGNKRGKLALWSAITCGAEILINREIGFNEHQVMAELAVHDQFRKKRHALIIASEKLLDIEADHLKDYYQNGVKATSSDAYMILEHWGNGQDQLISAGMQCWTGNVITNAYCQTAMGWLKDGDGFDGANRAGYVSYAESHDEERMQYKAKTYGNGDLQTNEAARLGRVAENVAFNVLLKGAHMLWQFEEIGYDISIDQNGRTGTKPNPTAKGYFKQAERIDAFTKCAQVITLRTQLMPEAFTGTPTVSIGSGKALRTIQWGSNVFAVANFDVSSNQAVSMPSGTWYDYLEGGNLSTVSTYVLKPGELKVFTGQQTKAPTFTDIETRDHTAVEEVWTNSTMPSAQKVFYNGTLYLRRGNTTYTIDGRRVE